MKAPLRSTGVSEAEGPAGTKCRLLLYLYGVVAAFSVLVLLTSLYFNHRLMNIYTESVRVNQEWDERLNRYRALGQLAAAVNVPGTDIYASNDVAGEAERMDAAQRALSEVLSAAKEDLRSESRIAPRNQEEPLKQEIEKLLEQLTEVEGVVARLSGEVEQIFSAFRQNQREAADIRVASLDRAFAGVNGALSNLREGVSDVQTLLLDRQLAAATSLQNFESVVVACVVVIAEDSTVNQKVAAVQVRKLGYRADVVSNGAEAHEALAKFNYDIVLMDCQMPEMDGYQATRLIRQREGAADRRTIIVAMTANALAGDRETLLAAGMDDYLSKPVRSEELQAVLERWRPEASSLHPAGDDAVTPDDVSLPVDMKRLLDAASGDEELMSELVEIYLCQMGVQVERLKAAVETKATEEIGRIVHTAMGGSAALGMVTLLRLFQELERISDENRLHDAERVVERIVGELERVESYSNGFITSESTA